MKLIKKLTAVVLAACLLIGLPFSIQAADTDRITFDKAILLQNEESYVKVRLIFSDKVAILKDGYLNLCNRQDTTGCSGSSTADWQISGNTANMTFVDGEIKDDKTYASIIDVKYSKCTCSTDKHPALWTSDELPSPSGVRISEYFSTDLGGVIGDGELYPIAIIGINGEKVYANTGNSGSDIAWCDLEKPVEFLGAAADDLTSRQVTLTFSAPVRLLQTGYVWLCDRPEPAPGSNVTNGYGETYTSWQVGVKSVEYLNDSDGDGYSDTVRLTFHAVSGYVGIPNDAVIRIVEYENTSLNILSTDFRNGVVNTNVIATADGNAVASNYTVATGVDIAYLPVTASQASIRPQSAQTVDADTVQVMFNGEVSLNADGVLLLETLEDEAGSAVAAVSAVNGMTRRQKTYATTWNIDVNKTQLTGEEILMLAADAGADLYDKGLVTDTQWQNGAYAAVYLSEWDDPAVSVDPGTQNDYVESGQAYNFMNCDTGRSLSLGGRDTFVLEKTGELANLYTVKDGEGNYISFKGAAPAVTATPSPILLYPCANDRYQIYVTPETVLSDNDAGTTSAAETVQVASTSQAISTGWYVTLAGATRPLKVMPLGDSITYGVTDGDTTDLEVGYREKLSEDLTGYFGRVVFVGSKVTASTTIGETRLMRHAGFPGYTVDFVWDDIAEKNASIHPGIAPFIDDLTTKYTPDVVCLMLGTNDMGMINASTEQTNDAQIAEWLVNYKAFILQIEETLGVNGTLFCSTLTPPRAGSTGYGQELQATANEGILELVAELAANGCRVVQADNYTAVNAVEETTHSGSVHLNTLGYETMAGEWYRVITAQYGDDSLKKATLQEILNSTAGTAVLHQDYTVGNLTVDADSTLDLNGYTLTADSVTAFGQIIDSGEGEGGIRVAKNTTAENHLILQEDNAMFPLYDGDFGGYRFFTVTLGAMQKGGLTTDSCKFGSQFTMNGKAFTLLMDAANADVWLEAKLALTLAGEAAADIAPIRFKDTTLATYADKKLNTAGNWAVTLTVYGLDSLSGTIRLSNDFTLRSSTNAAVAASTVSYTDNGISTDQGVEDW